MKHTVLLPIFLGLLLAGEALAQTTSFEHIVIVVQENRTPDNLFQGLCTPPFGTSASCSTAPTSGQYNIQTANWLNKYDKAQVTQPLPLPLVTTFDMGHNQPEWVKQCDEVNGTCLMDAAALVTCVRHSSPCPTHPAFHYVYDPNNPDLLYPYLTLATQYGWANYMFQTNQGPSMPAHQFIFGGTSAPSAADDAAGIFGVDNTTHQPGAVGCIAPSGTIEHLIEPGGAIVDGGYPCFEHLTMADLVSSWRYYAVAVGNIWNAPNAIGHICQSTGPNGTCAGWGGNVVLKPAQVLTDIARCDLANLVWVTPTGQNSDHASSNTGGGPDWVASVVNAIGANPACPDGETYWNNTAIVIVWDDWGGWYDHVAPQILPGVEGSYQYGFRVPLIFVSAYTSVGYISNTSQDFGTILRFAENNFGLTVGGLGFADARAADDLSEFYSFTFAARTFNPIPTLQSIKDFVEDKSPATDPDDD